MEGRYLEAMFVCDNFGGCRYVEEDTFRLEVVELGEGLGVEV